jgi:hypothetical protein
LLGPSPSPGPEAPAALVQEMASWLAEGQGARLLGAAHRVRVEVASALLALAQQVEGHQEAALAAGEGGCVGFGWMTMACRWLT